MKQVLQNLRSGATTVVDVAVPRPRPGHLLIATRQSLVSAGTERMLVEFGKAGWIEKARQQPDKVRMVLDKIRTDGLMPTIETVFNKLNQPLPLGYCNVGEIVEVGDGLSGFAIGDRVISNGKHAEVVGVPVNLCAKVPDAVSDEEAAFTVLGAIALQGIRLTKPTLGEAVVVIGLGLVGLMTVQLLRANGCRVLGIDFDPRKLALALGFGAEVVDLSAGEDSVRAAERFSRGRGVDAVIVTAATASSEPMHQAALMSRKRGRIILVGVTGLELSRDDFFAKELTFQVSASYGPGRYDPNYEEKGQDYPVGFVRWTEQRNFEAVLDMMADKRIDMRPLISHRFAIADAERAYEVVGGSEPSLGILLTYPGISPDSAQRTISLPPKRVGTAPPSDGVSVSVIGAGNYSSALLVPAFAKSGAHLRSIASSGGVTGRHVGTKFGFEETTTDTAHIFADGHTDAVIIATQHDTHAGFAIRALEAGKHVFVEKPLCLTLEELEAISETYIRARDALGNTPQLMVGFNRRFSPLVVKARALLAGCSGPRAFIMTVNAGAIAAEHWTQDRALGGGRIVGEACHFIDLLRHLAGSPITKWQKIAMDCPQNDTVGIQLTFADGSIGTINYLSNGSKAVAKERLEIFTAGRVLQLDNFRTLTGYGWPGFKKMRLWRQNKGQVNCAQAFLRSISSGVPAIPVEELLEVSRAAIEISR